MWRNGREFGQREGLGMKTPLDPRMSSALQFILSSNIHSKGDTGIDDPKDCNRECNGGATNSSDTCYKCLLAGEVNDFKDCNNDCDGNAVIDDCDVCTGGNTGKMANHLKDACGMSPTKL